MVAVAGGQGGNGEGGRVCEGGSGVVGGSYEAEDASDPP